MPDSQSLSFDKMFPRKNISELLSTPEVGYFVICATINGFVKVDQWWYPLCDCRRFLNNELGFYICDVCYRTTFSATPKFKFDVIVGDETGFAKFELFDHMILTISATGAHAMDPKFPLTRAGLESLNGKRLLFIVKKIPPLNQIQSNCFDVVRVSDDNEFIEAYIMEGKDYTPTKSKIEPLFLEGNPVASITFHVPTVSGRIGPKRKNFGKKHVVPPHLPQNMAR